MENSQGNSFIPKSPMKGTVKPRGVRKVYILTFATYVLFLGTILAAAGVFIYDLTLDNQLNAEKSRLSAERELFNQSDLERVRELESRMNTAFGILNRHVSVHSIFEALELTTLRPVQVSGFEFMKDVDNSLNLSLTVRAANFNNALFQRETFFSNGILNGAKVSEVAIAGSESSNQLEIGGSSVEFILSKVLTPGEIPYVVKLHAPVVIPVASDILDDAVDTEFGTSVLDQEVIPEQEVIDIIN